MRHYVLVSTVLVSALMAGTGPGLRAAKTATQEEDRVIERQVFPNAPVVITAIRVKKGSVEAGKKFKDDNDWFKGLTFRVENISDKPINYVSAVVIFVRPEEQKAAGRIPFGEPLLYGVSPFDTQVAAPSQPARSIPPGGSVELTLPEKYFEEYKAQLKKLEFPENIKRVELSIQEVGFEDGVVWSGGVLWRRDPNKPEKLIPEPQASKKARHNFLGLYPVGRTAISSATGRRWTTRGGRRPGAGRGTCSSSARRERQVESEKPGPPTGRNRRAAPGLAREAQALGSGGLSCRNRTPLCAESALC